MRSRTVGGWARARAGSLVSWLRRFRPWLPPRAGRRLDLGPPWGWPLGLSIGARYSSLPAAGDDIGRSERAGVLRLAYTGREDFVVGLDLSTQWLPQYSSDELMRAANIGLGMHYYF